MSRYTIAGIVFLGAGLSLWLALTLSPWFLLPAALFAPLAALGFSDLTQTRHSLLRNYPVIGHLRWLFEGIRPEIRQYLLESDEERVPFSREQRSLVYQRAKKELDKRPFGTEREVYEEGYAWLSHSIAPVAPDRERMRLTIGGPGCAKPYAASLLNISAMSYGSLSANAILALNKGAKAGGFYHDTGEGGISRYHRRHGGDLVWELGSGYFGCRTKEGRFDPERFRERAAEAQVKMIEVKLSQGAKPGHGGVLPGAKVSSAIAEARGIPAGRDCISPAAHSAFSTPVEFAEFLGQLRVLSDGRPVGFKLCVGRRHQFLALLKGFRETGIYPDFIIVDGKEGGTGAAPIEFLNHVGMPLFDGLPFVHNALVGAGLRERIRVGAAGKIISGFDMVRAMAHGADWCNAARGFMFALGCIQAQSCHTNHCPVGVATQDPLRARALVVGDKAARVAAFHRGTLDAFAELLGAAGLTAPGELRATLVHLRGGAGDTTDLTGRVDRLEPGELLDGARDAEFAQAWSLADPHSFEPRAV